MDYRYVTPGDACIDLANAIITRAVVDYEIAYMNHLEHPNEFKYKSSLIELRVFFRSEWFQNLTPLDADSLLKPIERRCQEKLKIQQELWNKRKEKLRGNN